METYPKYEDENLSEIFSAEMEFCKIDPLSSSMTSDLKKEENLRFDLVGSALKTAMSSASFSGTLKFVPSNSR
jgi:hypothetical protein